MVGLISTGATFTVTAHNNDDWSSGCYWIFLEKTRKIAAFGVNNTTTYLYDYSTLPSATPTFISAVAETWGIPKGNRLYCVTGATVHTYNITTAASPALIGGSSTYTGSSNYQTGQYDAVNNLLYMLRVDGLTDVLKINTGTDALTLLHTFAAWTINGSTILPRFNALSADGTKYSIADEYSDGPSTGGMLVYDVSSVNGGGNESQLFWFPCSSEPRGVFIPEGDSGTYYYYSCRYQFEVTDSTGKVIQVKNFAYLLPSQWRRIGVTSGQDPHGTSGPCTTPDFVLWLGGTNGFQDLITQCTGGSFAAIQNISDGVFVDAFWDGKYLWCCLTSQGYNGQAYVIPCTVTYGYGTTNQWTITPVAGQSPWISNFTGTPECSCALVPGTSYDANTAEVLVAFGWDPQYGDNQSSAGVHLVSFPNNTTPSEITNGVFPDAIFYPPATAPTVTAESGGVSDNTGLYASFQMIYYTATGNIAGLSPLSSVVQCVSPNTAWEIDLTNVTPPSAATSMSLVGGYSFTPTVSESIILPGYTGLNPATTTRVDYTSDIKTANGPQPPLPGDSMPTAGGCMNIVPDPATKRMYVCGGDNGVRTYNMNNNTLSSVLTSSGSNLPPFNNTKYQNLYCSQLALVTFGGRRFVVSNSYGANPGNVGNGMTAFEVTSNPDTPSPVWLGPSAGEGFTNASDNTFPLVWICFLNGIGGYVFQ